MKQFVVDFDLFEWVDVDPENFKIGDKVSIKSNQYFFHMITSIKEPTSLRNKVIGYTCYMRSGINKNSYSYNYISANAISAFEICRWVKLIPKLSVYDPSQQADEEDDI